MENTGNSEKKKAVFIDLDGTFWDHSNAPASAIEAIGKARENGHLVVVNTGQTWNGIPDDLWNMEFDAYCLCAGSSLYRSKNDAVISRFLSRDRIEAIMKIFRENDCGFSLENPEKSFYDPVYLERSPFFTRFPADGDIYKRAPMEEMTEDNWNRVQKFHFEGSHPFDLQALIEPYGFIAHFYTSAFSEGGKSEQLFRGELNDVNQDKARAMRESLEAMGYNPEDFTLVAIGDSNNDFPMIEAADIGIAMGNGSDQVKAIADLVTDEMFNDGLYKAFEKIGLFQTETEKKCNEE